MSDCFLSDLCIVKKIYSENFVERLIKKILDTVSSFIKGVAISLITLSNRNIILSFLFV